VLGLWGGNKVNRKIGIFVLLALKKSGRHITPQKQFYIQIIMVIKILLAQALDLSPFRLFTSLGLEHMIMS
jgi:hypothetical protein